MSRKILVVDDELSIREALTKVLKAENYEVVCAENGLEAIERLRSEKADLLLLDLGLPLKEGRDILFWLAGFNPRLPVIVITGRWNQKELAEKMGADALIAKPLDVPRLLETIRELLDECPESRARHRARHAAEFRYVPCDQALFLKSLDDRITTPYLFPRPGTSEPKKR